MITIIYVLSIVFGMVSGKLSCLDEEGSPVDMFVIYKLPEITWYNVPHVVEAGRGYVYLDSNLLTFRLGNNSIGNAESSSGRTLNQVYKRHEHYHHDKEMNHTEELDDMAHVFYNDEDPEGVEFFSNGHTKGALAFDDESGFWLISSVPKYPNGADSGYSYPHSGYMFGQLMICVTFKSSYFNDIGLQLLYTNPHVHDANLPEEWGKDYPNLKDLLKGEYIKDPPFTNVVTLTSLLGVDYQHFAKAGGFQKDLYFDLVAPHLKSNLIAETWQHGKNIGPSCHGTHTVLDVLKINITLHDESYSFQNGNDHAKFAIGDSQAKPYVCIGDINRQPSQFKRAGGTMCIDDKELWKEFRNLITEYTNCDKDEL